MQENIEIIIRKALKTKHYNIAKTIQQYEDNNDICDIILKIMFRCNKRNIMRLWCAMKDNLKQKFIDTTLNNYLNNTISYLSTTQLWIISYKDNTYFCDNKTIHTSILKSFLNYSNFCIDNNNIGILIYNLKSKPKNWKYVKSISFMVCDDYISNITKFKSIDILNILNNSVNKKFLSNEMYEHLYNAYILYKL